MTALTTITDMQSYNETNLSSFPFDFGGFGHRISALVNVKLFGEGFVLKVWVLIKILQNRDTISHTCQHTCVPSQHTDTK